MYTRNDSSKEISPTSLCIWWQTLIKESQPLSDAFFHFFKNLGWSRILGLTPPFWICHYLPGVLGEFSRQAWQVTSYPKSPRTTGNEAVICTLKQVASPLATGITASAVRYRTYRSIVYKQMKGTWRARGTSLPSPWSGVRECSNRTWLKSVVVCTIINPSESGSHESSHKGNTWPRLWQIDSDWLGARAQRIPKVKKKHWVVADKNENKTSDSVFVWILYNFQG